jgi:hypothetical protein
MFQQMKAYLLVLLVSGPWTVGAEALASTVNKFDCLQRTWGQAVEVVWGTEMKATLCGVCNNEYCFGLMPGKVILKHSNNLSSTVQHKSLSAAEGQYIAQMTIGTLKSICSYTLETYFGQGEILSLMILFPLGNCLFSQM